MSWLARLWARLTAWADADLRPGPIPAAGIAAGAVLSGGLVLFAPWWLRLAAVVALAFVGRFTPGLGRKMEGWHLEVVAGAWVMELLSWFACRGPCR